MPVLPGTGASSTFTPQVVHPASDDRLRALLVEVASLKIDRDKLDVQFRFADERAASSLAAMQASEHRSADLKVELGSANEMRRRTEHEAQLAVGAAQQREHEATRALQVLRAEMSHEFGRNVEVIRGDLEPTQP